MLAFLAIPVLDYYNTHDNFFVYGEYGLKNDYGGHNNYHYNNVYAYIYQAWTFCCVSGANDIFASNYLVLRRNYGYYSNCDLPPGTVGMQVYNNSVFCPSGTLNLTNVCNMTFSQWQAKGNDPGTTISLTPDIQTIINMGKQKLINN